MTQSQQIIPASSLSYTLQEKLKLNKRPRTCEGKPNRWETKERSRKKNPKTAEQQLGEFILFYGNNLLFIHQENIDQTFRRNINLASKQNHRSQSDTSDISDRCSYFSFTSCWPSASYLVHLSPDGWERGSFFCWLWSYFSYHTRTTLWFIWDIWTFWQMSGWKFTKKKPNKCLFGGSWIV